MQGSSENLACHVVSEQTDPKFAFFRSGALSLQPLVMLIKCLTNVLEKEGFYPRLHDTVFHGNIVPENNDKYQVLAYHSL